MNKYKKNGKMRAVMFKPHELIMLDLLKKELNIYSVSGVLRYLLYEEFEQKFSKEIVETIKEEIKLQKENEETPAAVE